MRIGREGGDKSEGIEEREGREGFRWIFEPGSGIQASPGFFAPGSTALYPGPWWAPLPSCSLMTTWFILFPFHSCPLFLFLSVALGFTCVPYHSLSDSSIHLGSLLLISQKMTFPWIKFKNLFTQHIIRSTRDLSHPAPCFPSPWPRWKFLARMISRRCPWTNWGPVGRLVGWLVGGRPLWAQTGESTNVPTDPSGMLRPAPSGSLANCPAVFLSYFSLWICYEIQLTNTKIQMSQTSRLSRAIN